jgi:hypothetical protein
MSYQEPVNLPKEVDSTLMNAVRRQRDDSRESHRVNRCKLKKRPRSINDQSYKTQLNEARGMPP